MAKSIGTTATRTYQSTNGSVMKLEFAAMKGLESIKACPVEHVSCRLSQSSLSFQGDLKIFNITTLKNNILKNKIFWKIVLLLYL